MFEGLLPIGTVVLLEDSEKRVMITGVLQKQIDKNTDKIWDYSAVLYPEGMMGPDKSFLFDSHQIEKIYFIGYQDEEQFAFKQQVDEIRKQLIGSDDEEVEIIREPEIDEEDNREE